MIWGDQQQKEIATIRERTFKLNLSDADVNRLALKAAEAGMTMEQLLVSFIGDLVDGTYSNGSDERDYAEAWYDRCGFSFYPANDLARLAKHDQLDSAVSECKAYRDSIETLELLKRELADPDCDYTTEEDVKGAEEDVAYCKEEIESTMKYAYCEGKVEEVVAAVLKWDEDLKRFKE